MIVSSITSPAGTGRKTQPAPETAPQAETLPSSRALVSLESPSRTTERYTARPSAPFVAHLIAMAEQAPQTCALLAGRCWSLAGCLWHEGRSNGCVYTRP